LSTIIVLAVSERINAKQRIFGFVLKASWGMLKGNDLCDVEFQFVCNVPQAHHLYISI
jgi:hypothetical protein